MSEQIVQKPIEALRKDWQNMKTSLRDCDDIRLEVFQETFESTELCLRSCIGAKAVSKEYIPLIADVYAFVDAEAGDDNVRIQTAKILAERLMYQYVVNEAVTDENASCISIYVLQIKRQLTLDLSDIAMAYAALLEALQ